MKHGAINKNNIKLTPVYLKKIGIMIAPKFLMKKFITKGTNYEVKHFYFCNYTFIK